LKDQTLIAQFRESGDREAVAKLFGRYESDLFNFIWQMLRQTQDAEDATQETFIKAMKALPRYRATARTATSRVGCIASRITKW